MKRVLRTALMAWLAVLLCFGMLAPAAQAAESDVIPTAEIPITVTMKGNTLPDSDEVTATIEAVDGAPLPDTTEITIKCDGTTGQGKGSFEISYSKVGIYQYILTIGTSSNDFAKDAEAQVYDVTVAVLNNSDMDGYVVSIIGYKDDEQYKDAFESTIEYYDPMTITVVKKWVDQDSSRPYYVTVNLLLDGDTVDTIKLYSSGSWQGTFEGLNPKYKYEVEEEKVSGYTATYKYDDENHIVYITNTGSLLQTGQLNWPIPVLCFCGLALVALGGVLMMRRKDENA